MLWSTFRQNLWQHKCYILLFKRADSLYKIQVMKRYNDIAFKNNTKLYMFPNSSENTQSPEILQYLKYKILNILNNFSFLQKVLDLLI